MHILADTSPPLAHLYATEINMNIDRFNDHFTIVAYTNVQQIFQHRELPKSEQNGTAWPLLHLLKALIQ